MDTKEAKHCCVGTATENMSDSNVKRNHRTIWQTDTSFSSRVEMISIVSPSQKRQRLSKLIAKTNSHRIDNLRQFDIRWSRLPIVLCWIPQASHTYHELC